MSEEKPSIAKTLAQAIVTEYIEPSETTVEFSVGYYCPDCGADGRFFGCF